MQRVFEERYLGYRIIAAEREGAWQARVEGIGALSDCRPTVVDAIGETKRYLDDQAAERSSAIIRAEALPAAGRGCLSVD